jgi:hypothetical protein
VVGYEGGTMDRSFLSPLFTQRRGESDRSVRFDTQLESHPTPITVWGSPVAPLRVTNHAPSSAPKLLLGQVQNKRSRKFVGTILHRTSCTVWKDAANPAQALRSAQEVGELPYTEERRPWWQRGGSEPDV